MKLKYKTSQNRQFFENKAYNLLDWWFLMTDKKRIRRTRNLRLIPQSCYRVGGKVSYAEWAYVIGIFQTIMFLNLPQKKGNKILDIGCGNGLLGIASEALVSGSGKYIGIDIDKERIEFCRQYYPNSNFEFLYLDVFQEMAQANQRQEPLEWPVDSTSFDLVTGLSLWTHLAEYEALLYFQEMSRILKPNAKAIITLFLLDDDYRNSIETRTRERGLFHGTSKDSWIFDQPAYNSKMWFYPKWARVPETAVGITNAGLDLLLTHSGMKQVEYYPGNWREAPGIFFQDILVLSKV